MMAIYFAGNKACVSAILWQYSRVPISVGEKHYIIWYKCPSVKANRKTCNKFLGKTPQNFLSKFYRGKFTFALIRHYLFNVKNSAMFWQPINLLNSKLVDSIIYVYPFLFVTLFQGKKNLFVKWWIYWLSLEFQNENFRK